MGPRSGLLRRPTPSPGNGYDKFGKRRETASSSSFELQKLACERERAELARLAHKWKADILCLQETHLQDTDTNPSIHSPEFDAEQLEWQM